MCSVPRASPCISSHTRDLLSHQSMYKCHRDCTWLRRTAFSVENKIILITIIFIYFTSDEKERNPILMPTSLKSTLTFIAIIIIIYTFVLVYKQSYQLFDSKVAFPCTFCHNCTLLCGSMNCFICKCKTKGPRVHLE